MTYEQIVVRECQRIACLVFDTYPADETIDVNALAALPEVRAIATQIADFVLKGRGAELPKIGDRVRLREEFEVYPTGIFPKGAAGTVATIHSEGTNLIGVKLDTHYPALDDWHNELHAYASSRESGESFAEYFWRTWEVAQ